MVAEMAETLSTVYNTANPKHSKCNTICCDHNRRRYMRTTLPHVADTTTACFCIYNTQDQGTTAKFGAVIDPFEKKTFARGLDNVEASRPTELANLTFFAPLTVPMPVLCISARKTQYERRIQQIKKSTPNHLNKL